MAKVNEETKSIINIDSNGYLALKEFDFNTVVSEEMDGLNTVFERIKMPSGGTTLFQLPADDTDEPSFVKDFSAVILHHHPIRAYFKTKFTGATNPPDCGSLDAVKGYGELGGDCRNCIYNDFNTGENGAKACKERQRLYLLQEGELFPIILSLPTGSLKEFSRYLMRLLTKGIKSNEVVTKFSLTTATNKGGIIYAKAAFKMERKLTSEELTLIASLSEQIRILSGRIGLEDAETDPAVLSVENQMSSAGFQQTA
ncbi:MAG: hypothetical protein J6O04_09730 [Selenomonadaceae bacterium]|nr:hypothetical protein [Selenomonadaceae bacterium]